MYIFENICVQLLSVWNRSSDMHKFIHYFWGLWNRLLNFAYIYFVILCPPFEFLKIILSFVVDSGVIIILVNFIQVIIIQVIIIRCCAGCHYRSYSPTDLNPWSFSWVHLVTFCCALMLNCPLFLPLGLFFCYDILQAFPFSFYIQWMMTNIF